MHTKSAARNIFYGGSLFFLLIFFGLSIQSHLYIVNTSTDHAGITEEVALGKKVWEDKACVNCHSILGEGAYYAPEVGNVWVRYGEGRRQMPQFNLSEKELDALAEFFRWVSTIDTNGWPPNEAG